VVSEHSNNCVGAIVFKDRLFMAWRSGPTHFASSQTKMFIVSSTDFGKTWEKEYELHTGKDLREPYFLEVNGELYFYNLQAGTDPIAFEADRMGVMKWLGTPGQWSKRGAWGQKDEVAWQYHAENGTAFTVSYSGSLLAKNHTDKIKGTVNLFFNFSSDGVTWNPLPDSTAEGVTYTGGINEIGWHFDLFGNVWGVGRNENGDESGWGSRMFRADATSPSNWEWFSAPTNHLANTSDPEIYESPRMLRHGNEIYLLARTDPKGPFWRRDSQIENDLPDILHHLVDLASYSLREHSTAIWRFDQEGRQLVKVLDLPGCGDNAFPSIVRTGPHKYIIFNYSSPGLDCDWSWIHGQISPSGTLIYMIDVEFSQA